MKTKSDEICNKLKALINTEEEALKKAHKKFLESGFGAENHATFVQAASSAMSSIRAYKQAIEIVEKAYEEEETKDQK